MTLLLQKTQDPSVPECLSVSSAEARLRTSWHPVPAAPRASVWPAVPGSASSVRRAESAGGGGRRTSGPPVPGAAREAGPPAAVAAAVGGESTRPPTSVLARVTERLQGRARAPTSEGDRLQCLYNFPCSGAVLTLGPHTPARGRRRAPADRVSLRVLLKAEAPSGSQRQRPALWLVLPTPRHPSGSLGSTEMGISPAARKLEATVSGAPFDPVFRGTAALLGGTVLRCGVTTTGQRAH